MKMTRFCAAAALLLTAFSQWLMADEKRPNLLFIISDDHSAAALGTCDKDSPVPLPGFRRLAQEGMVFDRSYCANSLCGPSRACMLTGRHSHKNGFLFNYGGPAFDGSQPTYTKMLQQAGYQTGIIGKWHLHSDPTGFDTWDIFPGQGDYWNPVFITRGPKGGRKQYKEKGYVSDIVTEKAIEWLRNRDKTKPFALIIGHKAPHRKWLMHPRHFNIVRKSVAKLTPPANLDENWENLPEGFLSNEQSIARHLCNWNDVHLIEEMIPFEVMKEIVAKPKLRQMVNQGRFKGEIPKNFDWDAHKPKFPAQFVGGFNVEASTSPEVSAAYRRFFEQRTATFIKNFRRGKYKTAHDMTEQRWRWYMEDYLGCVMGVDDSVAQLTKYLDKAGLSDDTLVIYVGDQSFFLGEHGLYDKRLIFEESFRMPLIMRWKGHITPGIRSQAMVQNIDYAPTIIELAGADSEENKRTFDGISLTPLFKTGDAPSFKNRPLYYAFYEQPGEHNAPRHDGIRTERYTFARIWTPTPEEKRSGARKPANEWLLIDNKKDPSQSRNVSQDPQYAKIMTELKALYEAQRQKYSVPDSLPGSSGPKPTVQASW